MNIGPDNNPLVFLLNEMPSPFAVAKNGSDCPLVIGEHVLSLLLGNAGKSSWAQTAVGLNDASDIGVDEKENNEVKNIKVPLAEVNGSVSAVGNDVDWSMTFNSGVLSGCSQSVCGNAAPVFPPVNLPTCRQLPSDSSIAPLEPSPLRSAPLWSSLFTKMPINDGLYSPICFDNVEIDGVIIPPKEVIEVGVDF